MMKKVETKIVSFIECFESDYHKRMILSNMVRNCDFLIDANNRQHTAKVGEITAIIENYDEARDEARLTRVGEYVDSLKTQHRDLMAYKADLLIAYKTVVGEDYEAPAQKKNATTHKAASKYLKEYAAN